jgi:uncharacterized protein (DUF302 family)
MADYGRRIVVDSAFETVACETNRAIREEGLHTIARIDLRTHFWQELGHDFRQYLLIDAWSPELAFSALQHDLDAAAMLPARFAVYELADGETAIVATEPLAPLANDFESRRDAPELAAIADREAERVARVLDRVQRACASPVAEPATV